MRTLQEARCHRSSFPPLPPRSQVLSLCSVFSAFPLRSLRLCGDMTMRTLVIAWGNPLRGDDGLGWQAAAALAQHGLEVRVSHQLAPEYAEEISRSDLVLFIDAACDNGSGELRSEKIEPRRSSSTDFSHHMDPAGLLGLAEGLYGSCPGAYLFSVGGRRFGYGEVLSEEVQSAMPELLARVRQVIETYSTRNHER